MHRIITHAQTEVGGGGAGSCEQCTIQIDYRREQGRKGTERTGKEGKGKGRKRDYWSVGLCVSLQTTFLCAGDLLKGNEKLCPFWNSGMGKLLFMLSISSTSTYAAKC